MMRTRGFRTGVLWSVAIVVTLAVLMWPSIPLAATSNINIAASGNNGSGVSDQPGIPCAEGGEGASWRYHYSGPASIPDVSVATDLDLYLDLHSETPGSPPAGGAWLWGDESRVLLENQRGTVSLRLGSGSCDDPTLVFDGTTASGVGVWEVDPDGGTGSYRQASGEGTFLLDQVNVGPGDENVFDIALDGSITVPDPSLAVEVVSASWDNVPRSPFRYANVTFRVLNAGPGDAFAVKLLDASTDTPGATSLGPVPQGLGDIAAGDDTLVTVRYQLDRGRCERNERACSLDVDLSVEMPDALDKPATHAATIEVSVPTMPGRG